MCVGPNLRSIPSLFTTLCVGRGRKGVVGTTVLGIRGFHVLYCTVLQSRGGFDEMAPVDK